MLNREEYLEKRRNLRVLLEEKRRKKNKEEEKKLRGLKNESAIWKFINRKIGKKKVWTNEQHRQRRMKRLFRGFTRGK